MTGQRSVSIKLFCTYLIFEIWTQCTAKEHVQFAAVKSQGTHHILRQGQELHALYRKRLNAGGTPALRIAYTCAQGDLCGGLGDRFKGFASTFVLALLLDAEFVVEWTHPVPIENFFDMPVTTSAEALRHAARNATTWSSIDVHQYSSELNKLRKINFESLWYGYDFVSVHLNGAVWNHFVFNDHLFGNGDKYNLDRFSKRQLFEVVMKEFFSDPIPALSSLISSNYLKLDSTFLIGVQIRIGGRWGDGPRYSGDIQNVTSCFVAETIRTCNASYYLRNCSVFFTTDQNEALSIFTDALKPHGIKVHSTTGDAVHSEKTEGNKRQHLKTFGDWYLLTMVSTLVNSRSSFSETASWFGNVPSRALTKSNGCLFSEEGIDIPDGAEYFNQER